MVALQEVSMSTKLNLQKCHKLSILTIVLLLLGFMVWGCGASRQTSNMEGEEINLDELLGEDSVAGKGSEESEVLRLLGITPAENRPQQREFTNLTNEAEKNASEKGVNELEQELLGKDREITELRTELTQKESQITELETKTKLPSRPATTIKPRVKSGRLSSEFKSRYDYAFEQFKARNYQGALTIYSELLLSDPNNSLSDNCQYWIGECYYGLVNYNQAITEFEKVFSFPNSNKNDDTQLKLGLCYLKLGDKQQARAELERLMSNYPDSEYISIAQRYLGRL